MPLSSPAAQARIERVLREAPALVAEVRLEAVLQRVADFAREIVGAKYVAVGLLAPTGARWTTSSSPGSRRRCTRRSAPSPRAAGSSAC